MRSDLRVSRMPSNVGRRSFATRIANDLRPTFEGILLTLRSDRMVRSGTNPRRAAHCVGATSPSMPERDRTEANHLNRGPYSRLEGIGSGHRSKLEPLC